MRRLCVLILLFGVFGNLGSALASLNLKQDVKKHY